LEIAVRTLDLTKRFGDLVAVDHVDLEVRRGEVFGFLGPNGAGKTTTIRMLVGLTTPSEGTALVAGYDIRSDIVEVKRRVGVVPETSNLYDELTVWDNLLFASRLYHVPRGERAERVEGLLETFNLQGRKNTKFGRLSKGLKRRAVVAAAMVHRPEVVFMDEPTSGLDVLSALSLRRYIKGLRLKDTTVFLTTHYIEEADQLSDRIGLIVEGKVVTVDTPENLKNAIAYKPVIEVHFKENPDPSLITEAESLGRVEREGRVMKIFAEDGVGALDTLLHIISRYKMGIEYLNTSRPSLEEAFVSLTGLSSEVMLAEKDRGRG